MPVADHRAYRHKGRDIADKFAHGFYKSGKRAGAPRPANASRRNRLEKDHAAWLAWYLPGVFTDPFTDGQLEDMAIMRRSIDNGGCFCFAAPRKDGKTARTVGMALYALLTGKRHFVVVVGADMSAARDEIMDAIKLHLRSSARLYDDYPEVCVPAREANDSAQRAKLFHVDGHDLRFYWGSEQLLLPSYPGGVPSSGGVLVPRGLTGRLRGMFHASEDGAHMRPDLYILDDPQTDESARSPKQIEYRERMTMGAVMGGEGEVQAAVLIPCTVIERGDYADRFLDRELHPEFQGRKRAMVVKWPKQQDKMWTRYQKLRRRGLIEGDEGREATAYYQEHRAEMDAGAVMDNENRYFAHELSALQHAENLLCDRGKVVFQAEYQNEPESLTMKAYELTARRVSRNLFGGKPRVCPPEAMTVNVGMDVNDYGLHWTMVAAAYDMTGFIVDYGKFPAKGVLVPKNGSDAAKAKAIFDGLTAVVRGLSDYHIDRGESHRAMFDSLLIDAGYMMGVVFRFCRHVRAPFKIEPSRGVAAVKYMARRPVGTPRDRCHRTEYAKKGVIVEHNADHWRMATQKAFLHAPGSPGSISIYGDDPKAHMDFATQMTNEYLVEHLKGETTEKYNWQQKPGSIHDWLDSTVIAMVAANMQGASFGGVLPGPAPAATPIRRKAKVARR